MLLNKMDTLFTQEYVNSFLKYLKINVKIITKTEVQNQYDEVYFIDSPEYILKTSNKKYLLINTEKEQLCGINLERYLDASFYYAKNGIDNGSVDYVIMYNSNNEFCGVMFAMKNECKEKKDKWSIRLVCSICKMGAIFVGLYLYCLKNIRQDIGFLEVAFGYDNLPAFCLYAKFGFKENHKMKCSIYDKDFNEDNVKMSIKLRDITKDEIFDIINYNSSKINLKICDKNIPINFREEEAETLQIKYEKKIRSSKVKRSNKVSKKSSKLKKVKGKKSVSKKKLKKK